MRNSMLIKGVVAAAVAALPLLCEAGSAVTTTANGAGNYVAAVQVNFQVTIPQMLYLRVGTGSAYTTGAFANNPAVDALTFAPTAAQVGNGTAVNASSGGDISTGVETAAVVSNGGTVTLVATNGGALADGAGDTINYNQITTTAATLSTTTALTPPTLANNTSNTVTLAPATGKVIDEDAKWTFQYANTAGVVPGAGTYGGTSVAANNGTVTYTATVP
jgi:hypothetical protein